MNSIYIAKHLPYVIHQPLSTLYINWNSKTIWDEELIVDLMEYFELDRDETLRMLKSGNRLTYDLWNELNPSTDEEKIEIWDFENEINLLTEYDTMFCIDVIEHVSRPKVVLKRIVRHLRTNGRLIIYEIFSNYTGNFLSIYLERVPFFNCLSSLSTYFFPQISVSNQSF